jgi:hypothetical protein
VLLAPLNLGLDVLKVGVDRLRARVKKRLEKVPPERQLPAPATMVPGALQYALLGDGDEAAVLRDMFEDLLVSSMDRETAADAHPAFASLIAQMTQEEAWILKSIDRPDYAACEVSQNAEHGKRSLGMYTLLGIDVVKDRKRRAQCISNLDRLGILRTSIDTAGDHREYDTLGKMIEAEHTDKQTWSTGMSIQVTPFGKRFLDTCVRVRRS